MKIGKSNQISKRIRAIQCHSPVPITLIGTSPIDIEAELHRKLREHHLYGEWFSLPAALDVLHLRLDQQNVDVMKLVVEAKATVTTNRMKTHCKRGHELTTENCVSSERGYRRCAICVRENEREYRKKNRERINAQARARRRLDPERVNAVERAWRLANLERQREKKRENQRAWRERNREREGEIKRAYRERKRARMSEQDLEQERAYFRAWRERNRDRINAAQRARRAAGRAA